MKQLRPIGRDCLCSACKQMFANEAAFDKHRIGRFGMRPAERRCVEPSSVGLVVNARGRWECPLSPLCMARLDVFRRRMAQTTTQGGEGLKTPFCATLEALAGGEPIEGDQ